MEPGIRICVVLFFKETIHLGSINKETKRMMNFHSSSSPLLVSHIAVSSSLAVSLSDSSHILI